MGICLNKQKLMCKVLVPSIITPIWRLWTHLCVLGWLSVKSTLELYNLQLHLSSPLTLPPSPHHRRASWPDAGPWSPHYRWATQIPLQRVARVHHSQGETPPGGHSCCEGQRCECSSSHLFLLPLLFLLLLRFYSSALFSTSFLSTFQHVPSPSLLLLPVFLLKEWIQHECKKQRILFRNCSVAVWYELPLVSLVL